ncbi:12003_t:CDS:1, partial [Gigaspora margarita]
IHSKYNTNIYLVSLLNDLLDIVANIFLPWKNFKPKPVIPST